MTARLLRVFFGALGVAIVGYGISGLIGEKAIPLTAVGEWLLGGVIAHDVIIAPTVFTVGAIASRFAPGRVRRWFVGVLVVGGALFLVALPAVLNKGKGTNYTVDSLDYSRNAWIVLGSVVAAGIALALADGWRRRESSRKTLRIEEAAPAPDGAEEPANLDSDVMNESADVLVVDDDPTVAEVVAAYLRRAGHHVRQVADGPSAVAAARDRLPDLVILDLMLPGLDGIEVHRRIRTMGPVPVIMLTAKGDESDRILGLEVGADDYVTKPFSPKELALRAQSVLRRARREASAEPDAADVRRVGELEVDVTGHRASRAGVPLALTGREFDLLAFFLAHPGEAFTRAELMHQVWGWEYGDQSTVTVHVRRLREKVEDDPAEPRLIVTVWGVGYRFDPPAAPAGNET